MTTRLAAARPRPMLSVLAATLLVCAPVGASAQGADGSASGAGQVKEPPAQTPNYIELYSAVALGSDAGALRQIRAGAEQGDAQAQLFLGQLYQQGRGLARDMAEADRWFRLAFEGARIRADQGDPGAQVVLAQMYASGSGVMQDAAESVRWYGLAANGYRPLAEQGDPDAQRMLGLMYQYGMGVPQDAAKAARWTSLTMAPVRARADQGDADAQYDLAVRYETAQDSAEAARWFLAAANQGHAGAQYRLGSLYQSGIGAAPSDAEAVRWLRAAADQGHAQALYDLAFNYQLGSLGLPRDWNEAARLYRASADRGNAPALNALDSLTQNMDAEMRWQRDQAEYERQMAADAAYNDQQLGMVLGALTGAVNAFAQQEAQQAYAAPQAYAPPRAAAQTYAPAPQTGSTAVYDQLSNTAGTSLNGQFTPAGENAGAAGSGARTPLNPATGRPCVTLTGYSSGQIGDTVFHYGDFNNSCSETYVVRARRSPSGVLSENGILAGRDMRLTCSEPGCTGYSEWWVAY